MCIEFGFFYIPYLYVCLYFFLCPIVLGGSCDNIVIVFLKLISSAYCQYAHLTSLLQLQKTSPRLEPLWPDENTPHIGFIVLQMILGSGDYLGECSHPHASLQSKFGRRPDLSIVFIELPPTIW